MCPQLLLMKQNRGLEIHPVVSAADPMDERQRQNSYPGFSHDLPGEEVEVSERHIKKDDAVNGETNQAAQQNGENQALLLQWCVNRHICKL